jgi:hypothetical protein
MKKAFAIPDDKLVPMLIAIGYLRRDAMLLQRAFRWPFKDFVSFELYGAGKVPG